MGEVPPQDEDWEKLPIDDRLAHKNWKARVSGSTSLLSLFHTLDPSLSDTSPPELQPYIKNPSLLRSLATDSNAVAQEKSLEALSAFVEVVGRRGAREVREWGGSGEKNSGGVLQGVIEKGLGSSRAGTKKWSAEIFLYWIEVEGDENPKLGKGGEEVIGILCEGVGYKVPKNVVGVVKTIGEIVRQFGPKIVSVKQIMKVIPKIFAHTDKNVRAEGSTLLSNLYAYLGPTLPTLLSSLDPPLKPVQLKDLTELFSTLDSGGKGAGTGKQVRLTRGQTREKMVREAEGQLEGRGGGDGDEDADDGGDEDADAGAGMDPFDLAEPTSILPKLPSDFYGHLGSSKWKERKEEALDPLHSTLSSTQRLSTSEDLSELIRGLAGRIGSDANVICVTLAANCLEMIGKGLRDGMNRYVSGSGGLGEGGWVRNLMERTKEKKPSVVEALQKALTESVGNRSKLDDLLPDIIHFLSHKTPAVRVEITKFLISLLCTTLFPPSKSSLPPLTSQLLSNLEDSNEPVRVASQEAFGTLMKVVGERALSKEMEKMDDLRKGKVKEFFEKAKVKAKPGMGGFQPQKGAAPPAIKGGGGATKPKPKPKAAAAPPKESPPDSRAESPAPPPPPKPKAPPARLAQKKPPAAAAPAAPAPKKPAGGGTSAAAPPKGKSAPAEPIKFKMSQEDAEARVEEGALPSDKVALLGESAWKMRLEGMDGLIEWLDGEGGVEEVEAELVVRFLKKKPGWKESNFQVYGKVVTIFQLLAERSPSFTKAAASLAIQPLVDKLGDIKLKKPAGDALEAFAEKSSLQFVLNQAYDAMGAQKSPKAQADCITWVDQALRDFGITGLSVRDVIEFLKKGLQSSNAQVRTSATKTIVTLKLYVGSNIATFLQDLNPQLLSTIESEFSKADGESPPEPTRTSADNAIPAASGGGGGGKGGKSGKAGGDPLDELFPRVEIEKLISGSNIAACNDANWKVRKEALESIQGILEANKRLKPNLSDLPTAIKPRLADTNKMVQGLAMDIVTRLANGMNEPFSKYVRVFLPPVATILADQKAPIRASAISTITAMVDATGLDHVAPGLGAALEIQNPVQRKEILLFLEPRFSDPGSLKSVDLSSFTVPIISCLEDRSAEVRKAAQAILPTIVAKVGYQRMIDQTNNLKPASRSLVVPFIESARQHAPEVPSAPAAFKPAATKALAPTSRSGSSAAATKPAGAATKPVGRPAQHPLSPPPRSSSRPSTPVHEDPRPSSRVGQQARTRLGAKAKASPAASKMAAPSTRPASVATQSHEHEPPFKSADPKFKRARASKETGPLKWVIDGVARPDQVDYLQQQSAPHMSFDLHALLFSKSHHSEKDFTAGLTILDDCAGDLAAAERYDMSWDEMKGRLVANADIVFKYVTIRLSDTNTTITMKCLDLLEHILAVLGEESYALSDYEAQALLPSLVGKSGDPKEVVRSRIRSLFHQVCNHYPYSRVFQIIHDTGLRSKNARTRTESADELGMLFQRHGLAACQPQKALPSIASLISDRDHTVRNAALSTLAQVYKITGDDLYSYVGKLPDKDKSMLEERLKRIPASPSTRAPSGLPGPSGETRIGIPKSSTGISRLPGKRRPSNTNGEEQLPPPGPPPSHPPPAPPASIPAPSSIKPPKGIPRPGGGIPRGGIPGPATSRLPMGRGIPQPRGRASQVHEAPPPPAIEEPEEEPHHDPEPDHEDERHDEEDHDAAALSEIETTITEILSSDPSGSTDALKAIQRDIANQPEVLANSANQLMEAVSMQMRLAFDDLNGETSQAILRLCKHLMQTLSTFFDQKVLATAVTRDALGQLLAELTRRLLDTAENAASESIMSLSKVLNMVLIRIFHHSDPSACFGALFHVLQTVTTDLRELRGTELADRAKYAELVMKCLWKVSKTVKESLESESLDPKGLLLDIDHFLQVVPPAEWRRRASDNIPLADMPLRTVKTILQQVVSVYGDSVYDELTLIDSPENSFVYQYLFRLLNNSKSGATGPTAGGGGGSASGAAEVARHNIDSSLPSRSNSLASLARAPSVTSSLHHDSYAPAPSAASAAGSGGGAATQGQSDTDIEINKRLKEIFDKIGRPDESQQGVAMLYQLQKQYPQTETRITAWMANTGHYFQSYIRRALDNLKNEDPERNDKNDPPAPTSTPPSRENGRERRVSSMSSSPRDSGFASSPSRLSKTKSTMSVGSEPASMSPRLSKTKSTMSVGSDDGRLQHLHQLFGFGGGGGAGDHKSRINGNGLGSRPTSGEMNGHGGGG